MTFYDILIQGGWFMLPIAMCSIVGLGLFVERLVFLRNSKILPTRYIDQVQDLLNQGRFRDAETLSRQDSSPVAKVLGEGMRYAGRPRAVIAEVMEEAAGREVHGMRRFTPALGSIATISPLLGLLGTVVGMIKMFQGVVISAADAGGGADISSMATGIWQALLTTAAGLLVAIPVFLAYRYVLAMIERHTVDMEDVARRAMEYLVDGRESPVITDEIEAHERRAAEAREAATSDEQLLVEAAQ